MCSEGYGSLVCLCVCVSVCLLSCISPLERLFILKSTSRIQQATKAKKFVGFSLKLLCCGDPALPSSYGHMYGQPFFMYMRYTYMYMHMRMCVPAHTC